jgi:hypothetical protein
MLWIAREGRTRINRKSKKARIEERGAKEKSEREKRYT